MATTELATTKSALVIGGRDDIKELASRIKLMMPNATKFTDNESLAVAQVAHMNGLDPFNGEVWGIKKDNDWRGVMVGVKGLRKASRRQADQEGGTFWTEFRQVEAAKYGATKPGSIVFECLLRDTVTVQAWAKSVNILTTAGVPYTEATKMLGPCPTVTGIGIADTGEPSRMGLVQRAKKRAEADAMKQRYNVSFGAGVIAEGDKMDDETAAAAEEGELIVNGTAVDVGPDLSSLAEQEASEDEPVAEETIPTPAYAAYLSAAATTTPMGRRLDALNDSQLESLINNKSAAADLKAQARIVLDYRIESAKSEAKTQAELGF